VEHVRDTAGHNYHEKWEVLMDVEQVETWQEKLRAAAQRYMETAAP
jgi:hypothetical protein